MNNSVTGWFAGRSILVTGATGFMGKVLVEKLLRSCPDIDAIYILVRHKRGKDPNQRLQDFLDSPAFDKIRDKSDPQFYFEKIHCVAGDVTQKNLNLSLQDQTVLESKISVVFHMAANVRFDQPLKSALLMNTGGTYNVLQMSEKFTKLKSFVHVSTAYCHCDETELEERPYKAPHSPRKLLEMVHWMDEKLIAVLTPYLLKSAPNTYAYTKCLTEQLVAEFQATLPVAITRPSIVTAAWKEPIPGWVENLNGPTGLLVGAGKGVIRSMHCRAEYEADIMPVDIAINSIILVGWQLGNKEKNIDNDPLVVNVCKSAENPVTWGEALEMGKKHFYKNPFTICLWYPNGSIKSSYWLHLISVFFFHILPSYFVDFLMILLRQKPFLIQTQKRIQSGLEVLQYYTTRKWVFHGDKIKMISKSLNDEDRKIFYTDIIELDWDQYILEYVLGARKYCIHEEPHTIPRARKILKRYGGFRECLAGSDAALAAKHQRCHYTKNFCFSLYYLDCLKDVIFLGIITWFFWYYILASFGTAIGSIPIKF